MNISKKNNITITKLKQFYLEDGDVLHALKSNENEYKGFQEAYFSKINPNKIKAWKRHLKMTMNLIVPVGNVQFIFYDKNKNFIDNIVIGESNYSRITVPPFTWFGFKCLSTYTSLILNLSDKLHDPKEVERMPLSFLNFLSD